jgi:hypothetical protein
VCKREFRKVSEVVSNTISGKGKRKRAPKVVQVKQKTQRSDVHYYPPQLNSAMAREVDIRDLMRLIFMPAMMGLAHDYDDDDDSDYNEDADEYDIQPPFRRARSVPTNETFENGHRVIEILDDEDGNAAVATPIRNASHHAPSVVTGYSRGHVAPRAQMLPAPRRYGSLELFVYASFSPFYFYFYFYFYFLSRYSGLCWSTDEDNQLEPMQSQEPWQTPDQPWTLAVESACHKPQLLALHRPPVQPFLLVK